MAFSMQATQLLFLSLLLILITTNSLEICQPTSCRENGPLIRFPFRLANSPSQHPKCGFNASFDLRCNEKRETILQLPSSVNISITRINYRSQTIQFRDPFSFFDEYLDDYVLFNCTSDQPREHYLHEIGCLGVDGYQVFSLSFDEYTDSYSLTNCTRTLEVRSVPGYVFRSENIWLHWSEPDCGRYENGNQYCRLSSNATTGNQIFCYDKPKGKSKTLLVADASQFLILVVLYCELWPRTDQYHFHICTGATLGSILFVAALAALYYVYMSIKTDKKIEKFLKDYKALRPTRFSYADMKRITKDFSEKLGEGGYGIVYKGKLSDEIYVAVKLLNNAKGNGEEFVNEVGTIGSIHHVNIVRLVGFCADGFRRALVYEYLPNESLEKFISMNGSKKNSLSWSKLQDISVGIAKGIEYLHQGCDQQILHFDIKPHNILLDSNFNPKICDFGLAKFCSKEQSAVSMTDARGTMGYIAPEMMSRTFGRVSYKSDVYSFGMMLLEMVGGRKNINVTTKNSEVYFPKWIYNHLIQGEENLLKVEEGGENKIARKLVFVGLWCIQWYPADRPSMKTVVQMLEGDVDNLNMPPNPFPQANNTGSNAAGVHGNETDLAAVPESDDKTA